MESATLPLVSSCMFYVAVLIDVLMVFLDHGVVLTCRLYFHAFNVRLVVFSCRMSSFTGASD